ncbi:MFS transporter [Entomospira entomophila]|uniref:Major facilitator superfamily (MFS) profile domain-containing protein n=1 Tax=Entomospira entomophila TaxID=2719988 RepID=A0A968KR14_9SPIO|nr:MFS transporter [Entomospira entomophilus]NIZ40273.1 hypothetical protein [Entomospira entomophilus]WDI35832.1 MFS transporter [Entomospira entomophilus]
MEVIHRLTSSQIRNGRKNFNIYQTLNGASFPLINGSIITLFAIQLGADSTFIGLISSFNYIAFIFVYFGRILEPRIGVVPLFFSAWFIRNLFMIPLPFIPILLLWNQHELALTLILVSSVGFNIARGPGIGANNAVVSALTTPKNQASYLSLTFMLNFGAMIFATILIGLVLRFSSSNISYALLIFLGIILGFLSTYYLWVLPRTPKTTAPQPFLKFLQSIFGRSAFRIFALVFFLISFVTAATRPFIVVFMRDVYHQNDSNAILFTVAGFVGAFLMSAFSKTLVQTVGAKTLFIFFTALSTISLIPAVISPNLEGIYLVIFLVLFNFIAVFGLQGIESTGQTYLFGIIKRNETMDAFILFFIIFGLGGALGSFAGGYFLNFLQTQIPSIRMSFQIFFIIALVLMIALLILMASLKNTNKTSVRVGLSVLINPRDIQSISLANRLGAATPSEIGPLLEQISRLESDAATEIIVENLSSPKLDIRRKALATLENISGSEQPPELIRALLQQLRNHTFTTAHVAARILGQHGVTQAIPSLRRAVATSDYRLKAEAITALARLKDSTSIFLIKRQIYQENNVYVIISSLHALQALLSVNDLYVLFWPLSWQKVDSIILNESILASSTLIGTLDLFYHRYLLFLDSPTDAYQEMTDLLQNTRGLSHADKQLLEQTIMYQTSQIAFMQYSALAIEGLTYIKSNSTLQSSFLRIAKNPILTRYAAMRFFITCNLILYKQNSKKHR